MGWHSNRLSAACRLGADVARTVWTAEDARGWDRLAQQLVSADEQVVDVQPRV